MVKLENVAEGISIGPKKGHIVSKIKRTPKPGRRKGRACERVNFVRELIKEVCGLNPYEKRSVEMLKIGKDKRCLKFLKRRIGSIRRAKRKREDLGKIILNMKRRA